MLPKAASTVQAILDWCTRKLPLLGSKTCEQLPCCPPLSSGHAQKPPPTDISQEVHFQHAPLDLNARTIRLVKIIPGSMRNGPIQCQMKHVTMSTVLEARLSVQDGEDHQPFGASKDDQVEEPYSCLSYTWGDPSPDTLFRSMESHIMYGRICGTSSIPFGPGKL
jgi:hypothetical protein